jgi:hypothetical protein
MHGYADSTFSWYLDGRGLIPKRGERCFPIPQRPDRLWDPPSLLASYRGQSGRVV